MFLIKHIQGKTHRALTDIFLEVNSEIGTVSFQNL